MSDETAFLAAIRAAPGDDAPRLVYADWLDEQDRHGGAYLRPECRLTAVPATDPRHAEIQVELRAASVGIDSEWLAAVSRAPIENCGVAFQFLCPEKWDRIQLMADESIRYCDVCRQKVFFCTTISVAKTHARLGECIASDTRLVRRPGDVESDEWTGMVTMGLPASIETSPPTKADDAPRRTFRRRR